MFTSPPQLHMAAVQELLELTDAEIQARVTARKPAAKLTKAVQHLQRTWLQVSSIWL